MSMLSTLPSAGSQAGFVSCARRKVSQWRTRLRDAWRGETAATFFDIHRAAEINDLLSRLGQAPIDPRKYRRAPPTAEAWKAHLAYQQRPDMRECLPLALTPRDRGLFLAWQIQHGCHEVGFSIDDALSAMYLADRDPSRGLVETYLLQPAWQLAVPDALSRDGWPRLKQWLQREYGLNSRWFRQAKLTTQDQPQSADVSVLGYFRYPSGLQQAARAMVAALEQAGLTVGLRDIPGLSRRENVTDRRLDALDLAPVSIIHAGLDTSADEAYWRSGMARMPGVHRVGYWWWELEEIPAKWRNRGEGVDEIWAPTEFIAAAMTVLGKPVRLMPPGLELPDFPRLPKPYFGMNPERFTFVIMFDVNSTMQRKNPLGAIRAFQMAFRRDEPVELIAKTTRPGSLIRPELAQLQEEAAAAGVRVIEAQYSREETLAFLAAADCLVSLHRAEGLGLPMAEAMLLGKPVIATGYSGNLQFMTAENSYLVDYRRSPIAYNDPPYEKGFIWAEPSIEHAARCMRAIVDNREEARKRGMIAREQLRAQYSLEAAGKRMRARIEAIREEQQARSRPQV